MKRIAALLLIITVFATGCAGTDKIPADDKKVYELVVLHTNDHHGSVMPSTKGRNNEPLKDGPAGGIAVRSTFIKEARAARGNVLLLDAGDLTYSAQPVSVFFDGDLDITLYNWLKYDAAAIGNNEFQRGVPMLRSQMEKAAFPFLGANVKYTGGSYVGEPWIIKNFDGLRVGIFGLLTASTAEVTPADGVIIGDEAAAGRQAVKYLREKEKCDVVIALTHIGVSESKNIYSSLNLARDVPGIDLIVDGHTHTYMTEPIVENGVPIVSAGEYGNNVGEAVMTISGGKVLSFRWRAVVMRGIEPDPEAEALIKPYAEKTGKAYGRIIGKCEADFQYGKDINKSETAIGNLTAEAAVRYVKGVLGKKADFALINSGTIRSGLPEGEISIWNILDILPFNNNITLVEIEGAGLIKFFRRLAAMPKGKKSFVQVSSDLRYTIDYTGGTGELKELYVKGETVSPGRPYSFATIDFITNGKGHSLKEDGKITDTGINLRQALIHYIERNKTVTPVTDGRIKVIE